MIEVRQYTCLGCGKIFTHNRSRVYKFCSTTCSNRMKGKLISEQNVNKKECVCCHITKVFGEFSLLHKFKPTSGRRDTCKMCSRNNELRDIRSRSWKYNSKKIMLDNSKQRAKRSGILFDLTMDDIEIPERCPALDIELFTCDKKNWVNSPSIDRIDNTKGYTKDNIVIVSRRANILKKDATLEELKKISDFYQQFNQ